MLPDIDLDNESFDDILENAKNSIVSSFPDWTDFNYHDPGVTMLEMIAWLKEIQQYYLNKIGPDNIQKYLKLLGLSRRTKCPSKAEINIRCKDDLVAAKGTRLYAGDICFETDERVFVSSSKIICCICKNGSEERVIDRGELSFGGNLRLNPFLGDSGGEFYIGFDKPLEKNEKHRLHFEINDLGTVKRCPITDPESFIPLVDVAAEYYGESGWSTLECIDGTFGFLSSGTMELNLNTTHCETDVGSRKAYYIRFRLTGGEYDMNPLIRSLEFNLLPAVQRLTKAECLDVPASEKVTLFTDLAARGVTRVYLKGKRAFFTRAANITKVLDENTGEVTISVPGAEKAESLKIINYDPELAYRNEIGFGTGLPFQEYDLDSESIEYENFQLMTELPGTGGVIVEWKKVKDFSSSKESDFVYVLDTAAGVVRFGDCLRGMAPEGRIFIAGWSETFGADGNVNVGRIDTIEGMDEFSIKITNTRRCEGGMNEETMEQCCGRAYRLMQTSETLVTDEDYENFIMNIQGLKIETCRVLPADNRNTPIRSIVVKPCNKNGRGVPDERYVKNILSALEKRRLLGTGFRIIRPEYAGVKVYADFTVERSEARAREIILNEIQQFFAGYYNKFGVKLIYSKLYEQLDRLGFVISINTLNMETQGSGAQLTREGDLFMSPHVMAYLSEAEVMLNY